MAAAPDAKVRVRAWSTGIPGFGVRVELATTVDDARLAQIIDSVFASVWRACPRTPDAVSVAVARRSELPAIDEVLDYADLHVPAVLLGLAADVRRFGNIRLERAELEARYGERAE
ncbi:hypothetical protein [Protaetiibacter intestinalis]|uniref:Uncharacterized protein n=1 Tax=Protaetiibacter intestinalis TaxID=2419774 RepID=A0A387BBQ6_9MICO|nr:hypothetical protein [Protaetiibacter intestinalis]AYF98525.1 hypothetical protein D7I47_09805 [Protaetiibacter intestinalis]